MPSTATIWDINNGNQTIGIPLGDNSSMIRAINNKGQVAMASHKYPQVHGYFYDPTAGKRRIDYLPGLEACYVWGINDLGQVVGDCRTYDHVTRCAFIWDSTGGTRSLDFGGEALDINNEGQVVGYESGKGAVVWNQAKGLQYLPSLPLSHYAIATAINDNGLITGRASMPDGYWHAVIWTPVPEPSSVLALLSGLGGVCLCMLRRKR